MAKTYEQINIIDRLFDEYKKFSNSFIGGLLDPKSHNISKSLINELIEDLPKEDINKTKDGMSLLTNAVNANHTDVVKKLIENGADVNDIESGCMNMLDNACFHNNYEIVEILIKANANMSYMNTGLGSVIQNGNYELCKLLLDNKCDPNKKTGSLMTPIRLAQYRPKILQLLLEYGAHDNEEPIVIEIGDLEIL